MCSEIINAFKDASHPGNVSGVLKELGDILLLTTARSTQKTYFPLLLFIMLWQNKGNTNWSFSGSAALKLYTDLCIAKGVTFRMRSGADPMRTGEVVNLNVLEKITTRGKWHGRKELNAIVLKRGEKAR